MSKNMPFNKGINTSGQDMSSIDQNVAVSKPSLWERFKSLFTINNQAQQTAQKEQPYTSFFRAKVKNTENEDNNEENDEQEGVGNSRWKWLAGAAGVGLAGGAVAQMKDEEKLQIIGTFPKSHISAKMQDFLDREARKDSPYFGGWLQGAQRSLDYRDEKISLIKLTNSSTVLNHADFSGAKIDALEVGGSLEINDSGFEGTSFMVVDAGSISISDSNFRNVRFGSDVTISRLSFYRTWLDGINFSKAKDLGYKYCGVNGYLKVINCGTNNGVKFTGSTLHNPLFENTSFTKSDFSKATMNGISFYGQGDADFLIKETSFSESKLGACDFDHGTCEAVSFDNALIETHIERRKWYPVHNFNRMILKKVTFKNTNFEKGVSFNDCKFEGVDFTGATNFEDLKFENCTFDKDCKGVEFAFPEIQDDFNN
jgi:uncharacterized protein YjbI with pentapeptide repeats